MSFSFFRFFDIRHYCPPVTIYGSALSNRPSVQNWIEEERGSVFLRTGTVSEAPYLRIVTPKTCVPP